MPKLIANLLQAASRCRLVFCRPAHPLRPLPAVQAGLPANSAGSTANPATGSGTSSVTGAKMR
nr:hypothetical protein [Phycisphaerae bacterium]